MRKKLISIVAVVVMIISMCSIIEAKTTTGLMGQDSQGRYFSTETGYFTVQGKTYYAHHSKSQMYAKGELATNTYRIRSNKLYYFGRDGAMITRKTSRDRATRFIDFNKDGSVHFIYPMGRGTKYERYNANRKRYQVFKRGKWRDTGMQCWPYGMIDHQW